MDVHDSATRSYNMSQIRGKNTKPEMVVRKYLHAQGFRFRLHGQYKGGLLPGRPDIVLPKYRTVIFVHGCFWHGHFGCKHFKIPETRTDFWKKKIYGNVARDLEYKEELEAMGWSVVVVWECAVGNGQKRLSVKK